MAQGAGGVGVAERLEALSCGLGREACLAGVEPRHRVEQRAVEELLVDTPHLAAMALPRVGELHDGVAAQAHRACDASQVLVRLRDHVRATQPVQLDPVLEGAQEGVRRREGARVLASDVAPGRQRLERVHRRPAVQHHVAATVHELQELHGELDVAQPAGAELELAVRILRGHVLLDASAHGLHVLDEVRPLCRAPHERRHDVDEAVPEVEVARGRSRLEQRLELPGGGPALVVAVVGREGPHERAVLALRAQVRVHLPDGALAGRGHARPHERLREARGGLHRLDLVDAVERLADEQHVDVGDVVELAPAALAHRHDGEAAALRVDGELHARDRERRLERGVGEVGQRGRDVDEGRAVARRRPQRSRAGVDGRRRAARGARRRRGGSPWGGPPGARHPQPRAARRGPGRPARRRRRRSVAGPPSAPDAGRGGRRARWTCRARRTREPAVRRRRRAPRRSHAPRDLVPRRRATAPPGRGPGRARARGRRRRRRRARRDPGRSAAARRGRRRRSRAGRACRAGCRPAGRGSRRASSHRSADAWTTSTKACANGRQASAISSARLDHVGEERLGRRARRRAPGLGRRRPRTPRCRRRPRGGTAPPTHARRGGRPGSRSPAWRPAGRLRRAARASRHRGTARPGARRQHAEQRVVRGGRAGGRARRRRPPALAARSTAPPQREGHQLPAEADAEHRDARRTRRRDESALGRQPRRTSSSHAAIAPPSTTSAVDVVGHRRRHGTAGVGVHLDQLDVALRPPPAEQRRRIGGVVAHDEESHAGGRRAHSTGR